MRGHGTWNVYLDSFHYLAIVFSCNNIKQQIGGQHYELLILRRLLKFSRTAKWDCNLNLHFSSRLIFGTHLFQAKLKFKWKQIPTINPLPQSFLDLISMFFFFFSWAVMCITLYGTTGNRVGKTKWEYSNFIPCQRVIQIRNQKYIFLLISPTCISSLHLHLGWHTQLTARITTGTKAASL